MAYKFGRTSGFTQGRLSFIRSHVRLPESSSETREQVFLAPSGSRHPFSEEGDSGAWVFDMLGNLGGLLVAGHLKTGWTYVTPISVVIADIEARLECKVMIPDA